jgi:hypothetical protein
MEVGVDCFDMSCHVFHGEIEKHHEKHHSSGSVG